MIALVALLLMQAPAGVRTLVATITHESGAPVEGLTADEVAVLENGVARDLVRIERDERPIDVAVVVDSSAPLGAAYRLNVVDAVLELLGGLPRHARFTLWTTGDRPEKQVALGRDTAAAAAALQRVIPRGGNTLFDAIVEATEDLPSPEGTRSAVLIVTATGIGFTNVDRTQVVERARQRVSLALAAQFELGGAFGDRVVGVSEVSQTDYDYVLNRLTKETGGRLERTLTPMGLKTALGRLVAEISGRYRITYATLDGLEKRKLEVEVARPDVEVRVSGLEGEPVR